MRRTLSSPCSRCPPPSSPESARSEPLPTRPPPPLAAATDRSARRDVGRQQLGRHRLDRRREDAQGAQARGEPDPGQGAGARRHPDRPREARVLHRHPAGAGRGPRPVRRRHVHHQGRASTSPSRGPASPTWSGSTSRRPSPVAADSIVREQQMDGHRTDHMGVSPDGRRLLVSDSTERQVIEYSMVDETVDGKTLKMGDRTRTLRVRRDAAREQLHQGRLAGLPREHRQGLHARRRARLRPGQDRPAARRAQGRPLVPDRAQLRPRRSPSAGTWARSSPRPATPT